MSWTSHVLDRCQLATFLQMVYSLQSTGLPFVCCSVVNTFLAACFCSQAAAAALSTYKVLLQCRQAVPLSPEILPTKYHKSVSNASKLASDGALIIV